VVGLSSSVLFDKGNPRNPINRRISIIVMTPRAEEEALRVDTGAPDDCRTVTCRCNSKRKDIGEPR
jgi:hypothetical protein